MNCILTVLNGFLMFDFFNKFALLLRMINQFKSADEVILTYKFFREKHILVKKFSTKISPRQTATWTSHNQFIWVMKIVVKGSSASKWHHFMRKWDFVQTRVRKCCSTNFSNKNPINLPIFHWY